MPGVDGLKTGFTNAAGFNLAASAVRNGNRLIAVVMGGSSGAVRNATVENLLLTGFDVEERRAHGEPLALRPEPIPARRDRRALRLRPLRSGERAGQGDGEEDGIGAVLARSPPRRCRCSGPAEARPQARNWRGPGRRLPQPARGEIRGGGLARRFAGYFNEAEGRLAGRRGAYLARLLRLRAMTRERLRRVRGRSRSHGRAVQSARSVLAS